MRGAGSLKTIKWGAFVCNRETQYNFEMESFRPKL